MAEPFNVEQFRQAMKEQAPTSPKPVPVRMQPVPSPTPHPYLAPKVPPHMLVDHAAPVVPQAPEPQSYPQVQFQVPAQQQAPIHAPAQAQTAPQPYSPPVAAQHQQWEITPQAHPQTMSAQQKAPQMMSQPSEMAYKQQAQALAPPAGAAAGVVMDEAPRKKSRFRLNRSKNKADLQEGSAKAVGVNKDTETSAFALKPFLLGVLTGVTLMLVAIVLF
jgi:hypothetical protein